MRIETYLLEQFITIARCGTLSAAAEEIHLSQPTLTRSMQKLEREIGVPLFEHSRNKTSINEYGKIVEEYANRILLLEDEMLNAIYLQERLRNTVSFGSNAPSPARDILPYLSAFVNGKRVSSVVKEDYELLEGLKNDRYQLILLNYPINDDTLFCKKVMGERAYYYFIPDENTADKTGITFKEISDQKILLYSGSGFWVDRVMSQLPSSNIILVKDIEKLNYIVQHSDLPAFGSEIAIRHNVRRPKRKAIPILDDAAYTDHYCICKASNIEMIKFINKLSSVLSTQTS